MSFSRSVRVTAPLLVVALSACSGSGSGMLVDLATVEAGDDCANGGLMIQTGVDANGDGALQADEISSSEFVCDGDSGVPAGSAALLRQTGLDEGDANCPFGGTQFDAGMDDGTPSGTAGDGILQDGEVDSTEYVCSGNPGAELDYVPISPPDGEVGPYSLRARGGEGLSDVGGNGGDIYMIMDDGSYGGGIHVYATGQADADWDYPTDIAVYLGDNPLVIAADTTLTVVEEPESLTIGDLFIDVSGNVRTYDAANNPVFTGVHVESGATLTVNSLARSSRATLTVEFDFYLEGTLTTGLFQAQRVDLSLDVFNFIGAATGSVDLTGPAVVDSRRGIPGVSDGSGGDFGVDADVGSVGGMAQDAGSIWNQAVINTSGSDGASGGDGGDVSLRAAMRVYNTADITALGGSGTNGDGGQGGEITFGSDYSNSLNSGTLNGSGGAAVNGDGGDGGDAQLYNDYYGDVRNSGDVITDGGAASCPMECSGGSAGSIDLDVYANPLTSSGDLLARGGAGTRTTNMRGRTGAFGGNGGDISISASYEDGYASGDYIPVGDFTFSGNWDVSGGDGDGGGDAGSIDVGMDNVYVPNQQSIRFYGYATIDAPGGAAVGTGGDGGLVEIYAVPAEGDDFPINDGPGASVANFADVDVSGGDSTGDGGGDAGYFELYTDGDYGFGSAWLVAENHGNIDASGGNGVLSALRGGNEGGNGGNGGGIYLFGMAGLVNTGNITADGGEGFHGGCAGCSDHNEYEDGVYLFSDAGDIVNSGDISLRGGDALSPSGFGGDSYTFEMVGWNVTTSGFIDASGGDGGADSGTGGSQDQAVNVMSLYGETDFTGAYIDVSGGEGDEAGDGGVALLDGQNVTDTLAPASTTR